MTFTLRSVLLIVAIILFVLAALGVPSGKYSLTNIGLAFFASAFLVP